jgi:hypothetical protein
MANVRQEWERDGRMHLKKELYSALEQNHPKMDFNELSKKMVFH